MPEEKRFYLTKKGLEKIEKEYENLKKIRYFKTRGESPKLLHSEDVNSEYLSFYEDLDLINTRLIELENVLKNLEIINIPPPEKRKIINLGARVFVDVGGQNDEFEIVGSLEANPSVGKISNESPVGAALLGHKTGDEVIVSSPIQTIYRIKKIDY